MLWRSHGHRQSHSSGWGMALGPGWGTEERCFKARRERAALSSAQIPARTGRELLGQSREEALPAPRRCACTALNSLHTPGPPCTPLGPPAHSWTPRHAPHTPARSYRLPHAPGHLRTPSHAPARPCRLLHSPARSRTPLNIPARRSIPAERAREGAMAQEGWHKEWGDGAGSRGWHREGGWHRALP